MTKTAVPSFLEPDMEAPRARGTIVVDPELNALNRISKILSGLDVLARRRVLVWLGSKYESELTAPETFDPCK